MKIGELFVELGVHADTFKVKDFIRALGEVPVAAVAAVGALAAVGNELFNMMTHTAEISNGLYIFRSETGLSTKELQQWQAVAKQVGVDNGVVTSSILGLSNALAQIQLGHGEALLPLGRLGVDFRGKTPFQLMEEIGRKAKTMDPNVARALMGQLGISPEMMRVLSVPAGERAKMMDVPLLNESDMRAMADFQQAIAHFSLVLEKTFVPVLTEIEPYIADLAEVLSDVLVFLGKGAGGALGVVHGMKEAKKHGVGWFSGDATPYFKGTVLDDHKKAPVTVNVTQNIHSTADASEVARVAHEHFNREKTKAAKGIDNGGY